MTSLPPAQTSKRHQKPRSPGNADLKAVSSMVSKLKAVQGPRASDRQLSDMKAAFRKSTGFGNTAGFLSKPKPPRHLAALETGLNAAYKYSKRHGAFVPSAKWNSGNQSKIVAFLTSGEPVLRSRHGANRTIVPAESSDAEVFLNETISPTNLRNSHHNMANVMLNRPSPAGSRDIFLDSQINFGT